jgi:uncharacterized protein YcnI
MLETTLRRAWLGAVLAAALLGGGAAAADAHIQVAPTEAAPNDAVEFTVLVPGERAPNWTKRVILKVPAGVLPYSFAATPGWSRRLVEAKDHSVDRIVWSGHLAPDGFVEFSFLAATPPKPGVLAWKALQVYDDGDVARWIGPPSSEEPAPTTAIKAGVTLQNAGGEGASGAALSAPAGVSEPARGGSSSNDWVARGIALAALAAGLAALGFVLLKRKEQR